MTTKPERGLRELYDDDPERADALVFGRRRFLAQSALAGMGAVLGLAIPFGRYMPAGLIPVALAESEDAFVIPGKDGLTVLNDRPINAETPTHLLDDEITPNSRHFVRNNGIVPERAETRDVSDWRLTVDGEVETPLTLTLGDLKSRFKTVSYALQLECGGNGRAAFNPPARGNQWTVGAIGNARWTGVRLRDVLKAAGIRDSAVYTGHYSEDLHLSGNPDKDAISRGGPTDKMMERHTLLAFEMNGEALPAQHGFPVRIVAPGWPGSVSQKWLRRIWVRDQVHDGAKMTGTSYRVPAYPVSPGQRVPKDDFRIIEAMPVKSLITFPKSGLELAAGTRSVEVRGHAWAGENRVAQLDVSRDFGATWQQAKLSAPPNRYSWQRWRAAVDLPGPGYYEIWARATDDEGASQPFAIDWNPKGYLNNSLHRIAVTVAA